MRSPADIINSEEYQLDRRAAALQRAGDWGGAIEALQRRKELLGLNWEDDKLAKYLQRAGRFDEAMLEIQWLLDHSQERARLLFGHQPTSVQQAQHATHCMRVHKAAALICRRQSQPELEAKSLALAARYGEIRKRLHPIARLEMKAAHAAAASRGR